MTDSTDDVNVHISTKKGPEVAAAVAKLFSAAIGESDNTKGPRSLFLVRGSKRKPAGDFTSPSAQPEPASEPPQLAVIEGGMAGKRKEVEDDDFVAF